MAGKAIHMRKAGDVVRLHKNGVSVRRISEILGIHRNTVKKYIEDGCPGSCVINNNDLHESTDSILSSNTPDDNWTSRIIWEEIRAQVLSGVSIEVIHEELRKEDLVPVQYSGFWKQLSKRVTLSKATMVKVHPPGIRCEIDYCDGISIYDPRTGEFQKTELFVGVLYRAFRNGFTSEFAIESLLLWLSLILLSKKLLRFSIKRSIELSKKQGRRCFKTKNPR
jgi:lambda repressor-like predicted transcriptional regulator